MGAAVEVMEARLKVWGLEIDKLAARTQAAGARARFEDIMHVDELKALHAIACSKLDELRGARGSKQARLKAEMEGVWSDLAAAFAGPTP